MSITSEAIWAASPSTTRGQSTPLSSDNKGERIAYASNKSIFVRSIDTPSISKQYTGHTANTTVARFSPSGFYIASGDAAGTVRVWDAAGADTTKGEYGIIAGRINDLAWDGDSQRIIAVGDGRERFGACITADSGNSVGEISGHNKQINCVSIRQQRPLRAATGSDDTSLCFFHGAPFKFNTSLRGKHDKFIYGTQFSPDGAHLVSVGSDRRIWLYDGKTGEAVQQIGEGEHKGSIFGVSWAGDSKRLVTCSGDQTVKIWDVEAGKTTQTWRQGDEGVVSVNDQQVGVTWPAARSDGLVISVDLEGNLNYFHAGTAGDKPTKVVRGHQKAITAAAASIQGSKTFWTGSYDGRLRAWDLTSGAADAIDGEAHSNYVSGVAATPDGKVVSIGWDDTLRTASESQKSFLGSVTKTDGQPKAVVVTTVANAPHTLVMTANGVTVYSASNETLYTIKTPSPPTALAAHGSTVAIGADDKSIRLYTLSSSSASPSGPTQTLSDATAPISALAFNPSGSHLAAGLSNGKIFVFAGGNGSDWKLETNRWSAHTARVTGVSWSPDGKFAVSGGLDTNLFVWSLADPGKRVKAGNAHKEGIGAVSWVDDGRVVSAGADASVKAWKVDGLK